MRSCRYDSVLLSTPYLYLEGTADNCCQRDTIERMNDEQKAKEAQHESRARRWSFNMRDIPEEINIV